MIAHCKSSSSCGPSHAAADASVGTAEQHIATMRNKVLRMRLPTDCDLGKMPVLLSLAHFREGVLCHE